MLNEMSEKCEGIQMGIPSVGGSRRGLYLLYQSQPAIFTWEAARLCDGPHASLEVLRAIGAIELLLARIASLTFTKDWRYTTASVSFVSGCRTGEGGGGGGEAEVHARRAG